MLSRRLLLAAGLLCGLVVPSVAQDSAYPNKMITVVVSYAPGGSTDILARAFAANFSRILKVPVVVENRPGAGGYVALRSIATTAPDGYTLMVGDNSLGLNSALQPERELKPNGALESIAGIGSAPLGVIITGKLPQKTLPEFIAYSKTLPDGIEFASSGIGSVSHMAYEALKDAAGMKGSHIPHKGGGEATAAVVGGHIQTMFASVGSSKRLASAGEVKVLAVTDSKRVPEFPDVPTLEELGIRSNMELRFWWGLFGPKGLPPAVRDKLQQAVAETLKDKETLERFEKIAVTPAFAPPAELAKLLDREVENWGKFVKEKNIKAE